MVQYLSPAWLARLPRAADGAGQASAGATRPLTLRHVVGDAPGGAAEYDIRVTSDGAVLTQAGEAPADVTFASDYETAAAIARGSLSTQAALAAGRLKVSGDLAALAGMAASISGTDVLPADLRDDTEFDP